MTPFFSTLWKNFSMWSAVMTGDLEKSSSKWVVCSLKMCEPSADVFQVMMQQWSHSCVPMSSQPADFAVWRLWP